MSIDKNFASHKKNAINVVEVVVGFSSRPTQINYLPHVSPLLKTLQFADEYPAYIRNKIVVNVIGDYVLFLDDDIILNDDYLNNLDQVFKENSSEIDVVGGPDCVYLNSSRLERAVSVALQSPLTTFKTRYRHNLLKYSSGHESNLTLCNLLVRTSICHQINFDERLLRNEENDFLNRLTILGYRMLRSENLFVYHKRRDGLLIFKPSFISGYYRFRMCMLRKENFDFIYFIPLLCLILAITLFFTYIDVLMLLMGFYFFLNLVTSFVYSLKNKEGQLFLWVIFAQVMIVSSYSLGQIYALCRVDLYGK